MTHFVTKMTAKDSPVFVCKSVTVVFTYFNLETNGVIVS